jgi:hypothetical protein
VTIGTWYFHCSTTDFLGRSERVRRGGFSSQVAAREARDACLDATAADRTAEGWTVERWLRHWLDSRLRIRPTTRLHYTRDLELALIPHLGKYRLADLDGPLLRAVFTKIAKIPNRKGLPQSPSAMQHLRNTLRAALNLAVREGLIDSNPTRHIEITGYQPAEGPDQRIRIPGIHRGRGRHLVSDGLARQRGQLRRLQPPTAVGRTRAGLRFCPTWESPRTPSDSQVMPPRNGDACRVRRPYSTSPRHAESKSLS